MDNAVIKYRQRRDARMKKRMDDFEEGKHKRDEHGRFVSGGGSAACFPPCNQPCPACRKNNCSSNPETPYEHLRGSDGIHHIHYSITSAALFCKSGFAPVGAALAL